MFRVMSAVLVLLLLVAPAMAQTTRPIDSPEATAVKAAAKEFLLSLAEKDVAAARKLFAGTDEDFKTVELMHGLFQAGLRMQAAAEAKFPEEMKNQRKSDDLDPKAMAERIDREPVNVTGDTAKFASGALLRKVDGQWKVVDLIADPFGKAMITPMATGLTPILTTAATDIESGKYKTFEEARTGIETQMRAAMQAARKAPTTQPR